MNAIVEWAGGPLDGEVYDCGLPNLPERFWLANTEYAEGVYVCRDPAVDEDGRIVYDWNELQPA